MKKITLVGWITYSLVFAILVSLFVMLGYSPKEKGSPKSSNPVKKSFSSTSSDATNQDQPAFFVSKISIKLGTACIFEKPSEYDKASIGLLGSLDFYIEANSKLTPYEGDKVNSITISNFQVLKKPTIGNPMFITSGLRKPLDLVSMKERAMPKTFAIPILEKQPSNEEDWSNYYVQNGTGHISILYYVSGLGDIPGADKNSSLLPTIQKLELKSDSVRSTIAFDVQIKTNSKHEFIRHMEIDMMEGEFIKDKSQATVLNVDNQQQPEKMPFLNIKH